MSSIDESLPSKPKTPECHRFFGYGKRIPRDVKRHCGMCRQHGVEVETRGHICQFKSCECDKCKLVRKRRSIMSTQIRLRREQDKRFQRTTIASEADVVPLNGSFEPDKQEEISLCYFCQKCKNHGILMWKKDHKRNCEYANCRCEQCDLIDTRRALDRHIKKSRDIKSANSSDYSYASSSDDYNSSCDSVSGPPPLTIPPKSMSSGPEALPLLPISDNPLHKPVATMDTTSLLFPNCNFSAFLPCIPKDTSLLPLMYSGGFLQSNTAEVLFSNIFGALSPFEIQLLLTSFRSNGDVASCFNF